MFTGDAVPLAAVALGTQAALSDENGYYVLNYILSEDDRQGARVPFSVTAENYFPRNEVVSVFPRDDVVRDIQLEYAAPIIRELSLYVMQFCQVLVLDYQGVGNIRQVLGHFSYVNDQNEVMSEITLPLTFRGVFGENIAGYQVYVPRISGDDALSPSFRIEVEDFDGFRDSESHFNDPRNPDPALFDPDL